MPSLNNSKAGQVDTSLPSNPIISASDLAQNGNVIEIFGARKVEKTQFGPAMFVDFMYADDPYNEEGLRDQHYTTVFSGPKDVGSQPSPAYKQLDAMLEELNYNDPLTCVIVYAGRTFKLADPTEASPTPQPVRKTAAPASRGQARTASGPVASTATRSPAPATRQQPRVTAGTIDENAEELPF